MSTTLIVLLLAALLCIAAFELSQKWFDWSSAVLEGQQGWRRS